MGLLGKASPIPKAGKKKNPPDKPPATSELKARLAGLEPSMFIPVSIFDEIVRVIRIRYGAFLLSDPVDGVLAPWALTGFDSTTRRRLRIPRQIVLRNSRLKQGHIVHLSGKHRSLLQPFFSVREFSLLNSIFLCPVVKEGRLIALLVLASDDERTLVRITSRVSFIKVFFNI